MLQLAAEFIQRRDRFVYWDFYAEYNVFESRISACHQCVTFSHIEGRSRKKVTILPSEEPSASGRCNCDTIDCMDAGGRATQEQLPEALSATVKDC